MSRIYSYSYSVFIFESNTFVFVFGFYFWNEYICIRIRWSKYYSLTSDNDNDNDNDNGNEDYLHPPGHIVPLCTIGDSTREILTTVTASKYWKIWLIWAGSQLQNIEKYDYKSGSGIALHCNMSFIGGSSSKRRGDIWSEHLF